MRFRFAWPRRHAEGGQIPPRYVVPHDSIPFRLTDPTPPEVSRRVARLGRRGLSAHLCMEVLMAADDALLTDLERLSDEQLRQLNQARQEREARA